MLKTLDQELLDRITRAVGHDPIDAGDEPALPEAQAPIDGVPLHFEAVAARAAPGRERDLLVRIAACLERAKSDPKLR